MKKYILPAIKLTALSMVLIMGAYTLILLGINKAIPGTGPDKITYNGKAYYANYGQKFTADKYFWSRPSAIGYNPIPSGGSNKGPNNPELLKTIQARIDTLLEHNPTIEKSQIPVDMITASASGLDPNISAQGAYIQISRISKVRNIPEKVLRKLVKKHIEEPFLGLFGPGDYVNVVKLNIVLDKLDEQLAVKVNNQQ